MDPPYRTRSTTTNAVKYHSEEFGRTAQETLLKEIKQLRDGGGSAVRRVDVRLRLRYNRRQSL
ncbi:hypothetical protein [Halogranum rubrum]|uniref:hypothetical protein n=1 Tax=Halogranum rubrum TaxID=553466 RepID=UPI0012F84959